ncbi:unnamed protein product [Arabidopsis lyrata]|uniref:Predicted protein n=1 Tax=Arabidopsis lyrata subsp. lyrata TaxID=81972 RepID=D7MML6_ARALL|nr:predicted protein [Arabidopsis lyrata subsp. lyrata]CAH8278918.1 unnamed protein product [Arabidopsis lyrata]
MEKTEWSDLPEELLDLIANLYSSNIDVLRIRSICKYWRSTVTMSKECLQFCFYSYLPTSNKKIKAHLFPTTFFRITLPSSCPNKGWLIRTSQASKYCKITLLSPISGELIIHSHQTLDLLKVGVSEIRQSYEIIKFDGLKDEEIPSDIFSNYDMKYDKKPSEGSRSWTKINNQVKDFLDIILHMGHIYAVDLKEQQTPSTPLD